GRDVLEVDEDALSSLRPEEGSGRVLTDRADVRLEHQVELSRLGEVAFAELAWMLRRAPPARALAELVGAVAELARPAVDERVGEPRDVAGRDPDLRVEDDRRVEADDVVALLDQRAAPLGLDVVVQQD